jgi:hypothetical protein
MKTGSAWIVSADHGYVLGRAAVGVEGPAMPERITVRIEEQNG